jgi:hypothetical protein
VNQHVDLDEVVGSAGALSFVVHEVPKGVRKGLAFCGGGAGCGV